MQFDCREDILQLTPLWQGERYDDGRPKVPDAHLKALHGMTMEEVWRYVYNNGYNFQFEGDLKLLHTGGVKMIGRAVTCNFCPSRPDLNDVVLEIGRSEGRVGVYNQWVVDSLVEGDILVADMYDKIYKGTFLGGNLLTAIASRTKNGGAVVWGGVRDIEQMRSIDNVQVYYRGIDPTPIREFTMLGFNTATRIGKAVCLPGDVVFGNEAGVLFIPSHMVAGAVNGAAKAHIKDIFGFEMLTSGTFSTAQIDLAVWSVEMMEKLTAFIADDPRGESYRDLDWSAELEAAKSAEQSGESAV